MAVVVVMVMMMMIMMMTTTMTMAATYPRRHDVSDDGGVDVGVRVDGALGHAERTGHHLTPQRRRAQYCRLRL